MGCGKSKHAVATETSIVKSSVSDDIKETKTVTEKGDSSLVQKEVETRSLVVENTKKETITTKPNVTLASEENVSKSEKNVTKSEAVIIKQEEKVNGPNPANAIVTKTDNVVPTPSKDNVRITEVVEEDEEKKESNQMADKEGKIDNVAPPKQVKTKAPLLIKDSNANREYMTPMLRHDSEKEKVEFVIADEKIVETLDDISNTEDEEVNDSEEEKEENEDIAPTGEPTTLESEEEEDEDVVVITGEIVDTESTPVTEPKKVLIVDEETVAEIQEKEA